MLTVSVPASTANLGPGYDVLGMALSVRNTFHFEPADRWLAGGQPIEPAAHLALHTAVRAAAHFGGTLPPLAVTWEEDVPRARGMGSSATVRVAGLEAALHFAGIPIPEADRLQFLSDEEGHPDNVVAAAVGGLTLCGQRDGRLTHLRLDPPDLYVALCIPGHEVSTDAARQRIPAQVAHEDAVFNVSSVAFLVAGLATGDRTSIAQGLQDRLHQPYRMPLIGPAQQAFDMALGHGALGAFVSGSGSTLAALVEGDRAAAETVAEAMASVFPDDATWRVTRPDPQGALVR